jgi:hypothetical protein
MRPPPDTCQQLPLRSRPGLSISHQIVALHGRQLELVFPSDDGALVVLHLPTGRRCGTRLEKGGGT